MPILMQGKLVEAFIVWVLGWVLTIPSAKEQANQDDDSSRHPAADLPRHLNLRHIVILSVFLPVAAAAVMQGSALKALAVCVLGMVCAIPGAKR